MSAKDYVKGDAVGFGQSVGNLINGIRDGVSAEDFTKLMSTLEAGARAINEAKDIPAAFGAHVVSGTSEVIGDKFQADAVAAEEDPELPAEEEIEPSEDAPAGEDHYGVERPE